MQDPAPVQTGQQPFLVEIPTQAGPLRPLTNAEIAAIKDRRSEMSEQLVSAQRRRENLLDDIREAPAGTEAGLQSQFQVLSDRIVQIERDIESSGQMLRTGMTVDNGVPLVAPPRPSGAIELRDQTIAIIGTSVTVFVLLPLAIGAMRLMFRRARRADAQPSAEQLERFNRLEQAVDAVAIEIERVGEAQRYQARVLSEANLMPALAPAQPAATPVPLREYEQHRSR